MAGALLRLVIRGSEYESDAGLVQAALDELLRTPHVDHLQAVVDDEVPRLTAEARYAVAGALEARGFMVPVASVRTAREAPPRGWTHVANGMKMI